MTGFKTLFKTDKVQRKSYRDRKKEYMLEQMELCRSLDQNKCQSPFCQRKAIFSWTIDVHHILGRGAAFLSVKFLVCLCRVCHTIVETDPGEMIRILEALEGRPNYRWQESLELLR